MGRGLDIMLLQVFDHQASHVWMCIILMEYPTTNQLRTFSSDVDAKLIEDQDIIIFIYLAAGWAVVLINHTLAIKESNKHTLTALPAAPFSLVATRVDATRQMIHFSGDYSY